MSSMPLERTSTPRTVSPEGWRLCVLDLEFCGVAQGKESLRRFESGVARGLQAVAGDVKEALQGERKAAICVIKEMLAGRKCRRY